MDFGVPSDIRSFYIIDSQDLTGEKRGPKRTHKRYGPHERRVNGVGKWIDWDKKRPVSHPDGNCVSFLIPQGKSVCSYQQKSDRIVLPSK